MGLSFSSLVLYSKKMLKYKQFGVTENIESVLVRSISFGFRNQQTMARTMSFKKNNNADNNETYNEVVMEKKRLKTTVSFNKLVLNAENLDLKGHDGDDSNDKLKRVESLHEPEILISPRPVSELDAAAVRLQKVYKSYRTRRNLADCAVVIEELWWKALDSAALKQSSVLFYEKSETAISRWARAGSRAAKVGKGLSKDENAQKLAFRHWLEAIDPRHRYGHNLHLYYVVWFDSESSQPFFYWLDVGEGREINLERCSRTKLQQENIKYLGPKEREVYEVNIEDGKLVYRRDHSLVNTVKDTKWIFVLSTSRKLYIGEKKKGLFQHSSFLAGGATTAAGRLVAHHGVLQAIWAYSGHYRPTEENFKELINFLEEQNVDLTNVETRPMDDDIPPSKSTDAAPKVESDETEIKRPANDISIEFITKETNNTDTTVEAKTEAEAAVFKRPKALSRKWSTGAGPRIGCVRDYPTMLQFQALEQVNLSPRTTPASCNNNPIPSPRPSPKVHLSSTLAYIGGGGVSSPRPPVAVVSAN